MTHTLPSALSAQADRVVPVSLATARELPGMLGRIVPPMLEAHGHYAATVGGIRTLYVRKQLREQTLKVGRE
jgi:hypothetical protein